MGREWKLISQDTLCITKVFSLTALVPNLAMQGRKGMEDAGFRAAVIVGHTLER